MGQITNREIMVKVEMLAETVKNFSIKFDDLSRAVIAHHALDASNCKKLDELYVDVHGDGDGKKGIRRELDRVLEFIDTYKKFVWLVVGAGVTSLVGAVIAIVVTSQGMR